MATTTAPQAVAEDGFKILFVGLICFVNQRKGRMVMLPDGRRLRRIAPHSPAIVVDPSMVIEAKGWPSSRAAQPFRVRGIFELPKCSLDVTGANTGQDFAPEQHDRFIPRLKAADPTANIDPKNANAVVRFNISSGTLEAFRTPDPNPSNAADAAVISRLTIQHQDEIIIKVNGTAAPRTLRLKPHTDIALANLMLHVEDTRQGEDHFKIYGQLTKRRAITGRPPNPDPRIPSLVRLHPIFGFGFGIQDGGVKCGNTGCCG